MTARAPLLCALALTLLALPAKAHDARPGAVALREVGPELFAVRITRPRPASGPPVDPAPEWPPGCSIEGERLRCPGGLAGPLRLPGLTGACEVLVSVQWSTGERFEALVDGRRPAARIDRRRPPGLAGWVRAGAGHVALGLDHLLFVLGLALVVRRRRPLLIAITGFTAAHSLALAAAAFGLVPPAGAAVELLIAASVLLLATEATRPPQRGPPLTARRPLLVVLPFGLLHGLGFAGPLAALGLPADGALRALFGFNIGVEVAQLGALAIVGLALWRWPAAARPAAWVTGVVAGYWTLDRGIAWLTGA